jgi:hypothetical protein
MKLENYGILSKQYITFDIMGDKTNMMLIL